MWQESPQQMWFCMACAYCDANDFEDNLGKASNLENTIFEINTFFFHQSSLRLKVPNSEKRLSKRVPSQISTGTFWGRRPKAIAAVFGEGTLLEGVFLPGVPKSSNVNAILDFLLHLFGF